MTDVSVIGRDAESAALRAFVASVETGPGALLVEGEAGIGKTTLWNATISEARARRFRALACRPGSPEVGLSFAALGDLFESIGVEAMGGLPPPQRRALEVALLLTEPGGQPPSERAIGVDVLGVLRVLGAAAPVVVAVDDAQWLDRSSAGVLEFAWRRLSEERVGFLVASRGTGGERGLELESVTPESVARVEVGPLSAGAIQRLLRKRLGVTFSRPTLLRLHEASGGNPFYALELGRVLQRSGGLAAADQPLPVADTLAALMRARVAGLPPDVGEVLLAIAAAGEPSVSLLETYTGERGRVGERLGRAATAGVVRFDGERVRFAHPLLAAGVYADAAPQVRRRVHRRLAEVAANPEERARHLALACAGPDVEAAAALDGAASSVSMRGASASAAELAELAAKLTPSDSRGDLVRRSLAAADHHLESGAFDRAVALLEPLLEELPAGCERADVLVRLAAANDDLVASVELCEQALVAAQGDDRRLSRIHSLLGAGWPVRGGSRHALAHGRLALEHGERCGDRAIVAAALARLALWEIWAVEPTPGLLERALALEDPTVELGLLVSPRVTLALLRTYQGRFHEARQALQAALGEATTRGDELRWVELHGRLAELDCRAGEWAQAAEHAAASFELSEQIGLEHVGPPTLFRKALVDAHYGHVTEARAAAEQGAALSAAPQDELHQLFNRGVLGFVELSLGNAAEADRYLRPTLTWLAKLRMGLATFPVAPYALEALIEVGGLDQARPFVSQLDREGAVLQSGWTLAITARLRGLLEAGDGNLPAAAEHLERALQQQDGRFDVAIEDGKVTAYRVRLDISFKYEAAD